MSSSPDALVILLHGVGSNGADLARLSGPLSLHLPGAVFAAPNAPTPFQLRGAGYQWFSIASVSSQNRAERIAGAREGYNRVVSAEIDKHGFAGRLDRVALFGFSQGAIMSLDAIASGRWPVGAVVAASGRLATAPGAHPAIGTPTLLLHGAEDEIVPAEATPEAAAFLESLGFAVEAHVYPGLGHSISREGLEAAGVFLARHLGRASI